MALKDKIPTTYNSIRLIEWTIALCSIGVGIYIFTPLYDFSRSQAGPGVVFQIFASQIGVMLFAGLLIIAGLLVIAGIKTNRPSLRGTGFFCIAMARFFQILSTFIVVGILPLTWIHTFTVMVICVILWGQARIEVRSRGA